MKHRLFGFLMVVAMCIPAFAALQLGERAPVFSARASLAG